MDRVDNTIEFIEKNLQWRCSSNGLCGRGNAQRNGSSDAIAQKSLLKNKPRDRYKLFLNFGTS